jgi:DNA-binding CsgD family transcriptional regulator
MKTLLKANAYNNQWVELIYIKREITKLKQSEESLKKSQAKLEQRIKEQDLELERKNHELTIKTKEIENFKAALSVLLKKREKDSIEIEKAILSNVEYSIDPYIQNLKKNHLTKRQKSILSIIQKNLDEIVSPMTQKISTAYYNLTPREIQIANLIKIGKTNKEMADIVCLSVKTIEFHRDNLRKKLRLRNQKINLRTHLLSLH